MKRFFITFAAVVAALVVVASGLAFIGYSKQWERTKAGWLNQLATQEQRRRELIAESKDYDEAKALDISGVAIAHTKELLVKHYQSKAWFYSTAERQHVKRWAEEVVAFNGRPPLRSATDPSLRFPPIPTTEHPHLAGPPYPYAARERHLVGSGYARASFDDSGHCSNVVMTVSTGWGVLDVNTITFGQENWMGAPNTSVEVPVTYQLR